jgi:hypothetical protein
MLYATELCCPIPSNHGLYITLLYYVTLEFFVLDLLLIVRSFS